MSIIIKLLFLLMSFNFKSPSVDYYFNKLPEEVQMVFYQDGWTYKKVDYSLGTKYYDDYKDVLGLTDWNNKIIYIGNKETANKSILHEVGHRFQYEPYVKGHNSLEFKDLYDKNWANWYLAYGGSLNNYYSELEAYAQCYEIYFLKPECLDKDTYNFIENEIHLIKLQMSPEAPE